MVPPNRSSAGYVEALMSSPRCICTEYCKRGGRTTGRRGHLHGLQSAGPGVHGGLVRDRLWGVVHFCHRAAGGVIAYHPLTPSPPTPLPVGEGRESEREGMGVAPIPSLSANMRHE